MVFVTLKYTGEKYMSMHHKFVLTVIDNASFKKVFKKERKPQNSLNSFTN